jgi:hypothetical protein
MLLEPEADDEVVLNDFAAAVMHITVMTVILTRNANNVRRVALGMSNGGEEYLDGVGMGMGGIWGECGFLAAGGHLAPHPQVDASPHLRWARQRTRVLGADNRQRNHLLDGWGEKGWGTISVTIHVVFVSCIRLC